MRLLRFFALSASFLPFGAFRSGRTLMQFFGVSALPFSSCLKHSFYYEIDTPLILQFPYYTMILFSPVNIDHIFNQINSLSNFINLFHLCKYFCYFFYVFMLIFFLFVSNFSFLLSCLYFVDVSFFVNFKNFYLSFLFQLLLFVCLNFKLFFTYLSFLHNFISNWLLLY